MFSNSTIESLSELGNRLNKILSVLAEGKPLTMLVQNFKNFPNHD